MVTGGHLPITLEQAIFMASLQLHLDVSAEEGVWLATTFDPDFNPLLSPGYHW